MTYPRSGSHPISVHRQFSQSFTGLGTAAGKRMGFRGGQVGVPPSLEGKESTPFSCSFCFSSSERSPGFPSSGCGGPEPSHQRCGRIGSRQELPRLLRPVVCGAESLRGLEAGVGPIYSEHIPTAKTISYGDSNVNPGVNAPRGLGSFIGPQGRLFPLINPRGRQEIPQVFLGREGVSVQGTPIWACPSTMGLHQDYERVMCGSQGPRHQTQGLSGRLASVGQYRSTVFRSSSSGVGLLSEARVRPQCREVRLGPRPEFHIPGHAVRYSQVDCCSVSTAHWSSSGNPSVGSGIASSPSSSSCLHTGYDGIDVSSPSSWSPAQASDTAPVSGRVGQSRESLVSTYSPGSSFSRSSVSVAGFGMVGSGSSDLPTPSSGGPVHRFLSGGLGSPHGRSNGVRSVVSGPSSVTHQHARIGGSMDGAERVCQCCRGQACLAQYRQHDSGVICQQTRGGTLSLSVSENRGYAAVVSGPQDRADGQICAREIECPGRLSKQGPYGVTYGMDANSSGSTTGVVGLVQAADRSICHQVQQEASPVRVPSPRPPSVGGRCSVDTVVKSSGLRLSPDLHAGEGHKKGKGRESSPHSHSSSLGVKALVPGSSRSESRGSNSSSSRSQRSSAAKDRRSSRKSGGHEFARVASVRDSLRSRGVSENAIDLVEQAHRPGTKKVYKSRWKAWCKYCGEKGFSPTSPSQVQLANYLAFLSKIKKLSASAVKGHRSAISTTLKQLGRRSFSEDPLLRDIMKGASLQEARTRKRFPAWDVFTVLKMLRLPPYEPIESVELKFLAYKTAFLIALASGRRCSEIHALQFGSLAYEPDGSISLRFLPEFLAKNQPVGLPSPPIIIKPLSSILCDDDEDITLCPARCLKMYLKKSKFLRSPTKRRLFVSVREDKKSDITSATISRWLKTVIRAAFASSVNGSERFRAHEIRAWASSLAWHNNTSLHDIMEAAYWTSPATFLQFYLRDVSHTKEDGSRGISFVAAQQSISSATRSKGFKGPKSARH